MHPEYLPRDKRQSLHAQIRTLYALADVASVEHEDKMKHDTFRGEIEWILGTRYPQPTTATQKRAKNIIQSKIISFDSVEF